MFSLPIPIIPANGHHWFYLFITVGPTSDSAWFHNINLLEFNTFIMWILMLRMKIEITSALFKTCNFESQGLLLTWRPLSGRDIGTDNRPWVFTLLHGSTQIWDKYLAFPIDLSHPPYHIEVNEFYSLWIVFWNDSRRFGFSTRSLGHMMFSF